MTPLRRQQNPFANPVLIGALIVLITIVAVAIAYNANNGLPFVPRYTLNVRVRDASELTHGDDVRIGGTLVGFVNAVTPARDSTGRPLAVVNVKLDKSVEPLPVNSTFVIRLKGAIGLKYLQIIPGNATQGFPNGATVPVAQSGATTDLDQVLSMFTPPTRTGVANSTLGFGAGLAGRGGNLNDAIGAFVPLLGDLSPVARNLASPQTNLAGFFTGLESFTGALAPVAQTQADLFGNLDTTFRALAGVAVPYLQNTISETPPTFSTVIADSPSIRPFLTDTASLFAELRPLVAASAQTAPTLAETFAIGTRTLPPTAALDARLTSLALTLGSYSTNPAVQQGLDRLTLTVSRLGPPLAFLTPVQASCNYVTLFFRNVASVLSEHTSSGTALAFAPVSPDPIVLGGENVPSHKPYVTPNLHPASNPNIGPLHVNPYPNTDSPGQTPECAAGNETYSPKQARLGNPPGNVGLGTDHVAGKPQ